MPSSRRWLAREIGMAGLELIKGAFTSLSKNNSPLFITRQQRTSDSRPLACYTLGERIIPCLILPKRPIDNPDPPSPAPGCARNYQTNR